MKRTKPKKRDDAHAYLYVTTICPECSANLRNTHSVKVELTLDDCNSDRNASFLSQLDNDGWLDDIAGHVAKGLHSTTECSSCGHDLYLYEAKHWGQPAPAKNHLFVWSREDLIGLHKFPPGDVSGLVQQLCRYVVDNHHDQLAHGEAIDLQKKAEEVIAHVTEHMRAWAKKAQDHTKRWRDICEQETV